MKNANSDQPLAQVIKSRNYQKSWRMSLLALVLSLTGSGCLLIDGSSPGFQGIPHGVAYAGRVEAETSMLTIIVLGLVFSITGIITGLLNKRIWVSKLAIALPIVTWCWLSTQGWHYNWP